MRKWLFSWPRKKFLVSKMFRRSLKLSFHVCTGLGQLCSITHNTRKWIWARISSDQLFSIPTHPLRTRARKQSEMALRECVYIMKRLAVNIAQLHRSSTDEAKWFPFSHICISLLTLFVGLLCDVVVPWTSWSNFPFSDALPLLRSACCWRRVWRKSQFFPHRL